MTGYLHIPDDAKFAAAVQDAIRDYPCALGHEGDECPTAIAVLSVLRGLSVEPTEERPAFEVKAMRLPPHGALRFIYHNAAGRQVSTFYPYVRRLHRTHFDHVGEVFKLLAAAPVPVQEDRP